MKYMLLFSAIIGILMNSSCSTKKENNKNDSLAYHQPAVILESKVVGDEHQNEKKLLRKKVKSFDKSVRNELEDVSEWFNNVGEAIDMME